MTFFRTVGLLLWKNFLLQKRKICVSIFEILLPVLFAIVFLAVRSIISQEVTDNPTIYPDRSCSDLQGTLYENTSIPVQYLLYLPNNSLAGGIMKTTEELLRNQSVRVQVKGFHNEEDMLEFLRNNFDNVSSAVHFNNIAADQTTLPYKLEYTIRPKIYNNSYKWSTKNTYPFFQSASPRNIKEPPYLWSGFILYQRYIGEAVIRQWNASVGALFDSLEIRIQRMPFPPYIKDTMIFVLQNQISIILMLSFILSTIQNTKALVYEKENRLKEAMKLMGLSSAAHWTAWFVTVFIYIIIIMAIYALLFGIDASDAGPVLPNSDPSLFFVFLLCYGLSIVAFSFMVSTIVQKANVGAALAGILFFVTYLPYFFIQSDYATMSRSQKLAACLFMNMAMAFGGNSIGLYEGTGAGVQWNNFHEPASIDDNFAMLDAMLMLLGDSAIYFLIMWYVDNVRPGEFGTPKPYYFLFTSSYWCGTHHTKIDNYDVESGSSKSNFYEREPTGLKSGIQIKKLKKVYGKNKKPAVNDISLNMFEGQITVLLGHNGAGKTTTMSVLTGFFPPTSGTAIVNGYDITTDILGVRKSLGLCPQHNILFDTLTVEEHLTFYAGLKGCPRGDVKTEVDKMVHEVGLDLKRSAKSMTLSGGQKRKLSVGIALIAGSKIVILDEPTSGMDPASRRHIWDILQGNREGRTLVLTTHFMDEADLLGDRIAIMAEGVIRCCGTSYFLKKAYGTGYHLVIVKEPTCRISAVTEAITKIIPLASLESEINAEISYLLPEDQSHLFASLFTDIEKRKQELGITSFGTSATSMEEVFLKVGEITESDNNEYELASQENSFEAYANPAMEYYSEKTNGVIEGSPRGTTASYGSVEVAVELNDNILDFNTGYTKVTGLLLELYRFRGLFVKKAIHSLRNWKITIVQLLLPVIGAILALVVAGLSSNPSADVSLPLDLSHFGGTIIPYTNGTSPTKMTQDLAEAYSNLFDKSTDTPENINKKNISKYFLDKSTELGLSSFDKRVIIAGEYNSIGSSTVSRAHFNGQPYHAMPIALAYLMNAVVSKFVGEDHEIKTFNSPLPKRPSDSSEQDQSRALLLGFAVSFNVLFGMAFLTSSFVYFLIKERLVGAKHLQVVSGIGPLIFWMSNFAWDYINYFIPCILILPVFGAFQTPAYTEDNRLGIVFLSLIFYGWAVIPFMYILQYLFKSPATGMVTVLLLNIATGLMTTMATYILSTPSLGVEDVADVLGWIFLLFFPHYCLGQCFMQVFVNYFNQDICSKLPGCLPSGRPSPCCKSNCGDKCLPREDDYMAWDLPGVGRYLFFMVLQGFIFLAATLLIEYQVPQMVWYKIRPPDDDSADRIGSEIDLQYTSTAPNEDSDVMAEKDRINKGTVTKLSLTDSLILRNLYKRYGNVVVVDHLTVGIPDKECFGLLGQNGAGKTTTFKMLTGDVMLTGGNAYLKGHDVKTETQKVQENMGYCPQFDALIDQMTGRETLWMFARFKGVPENNIDGVVDKLMEIMMLTQYADRQTSKYSGGNKRKLSTAIALIGDPSFIMLDEPSTGMDPKARRQLWNVLSHVRASGKTLVLTSHSMEECDALCTRIAIMVNGRFVCLGSPQHLKNKFGQGYTLIAQMIVKDGEQLSTEPLTEFIKGKFRDSLVFESHQGYAHFQIPDPEVHLATVFNVMEESKAVYGVEDYSVHQTTLEQVFLTFTRAQIPPREDETTFCKRICCC